MAFPNVSDIIATTIEARSGKIRDNVTKNNALLARLKQKGKIRTVSGGRLIYEELSFAENGNGGYYSGYDTLPVSSADVITAAEYNWKQIAVPITISGLEMGQNSGKEAIIDLLEGRLNVGESTMENIVSVGLYSDGTGSGGKQRLRDWTRPCRRTQPPARMAPLTGRRPATSSGARSFMTRPAPPPPPPFRGT
jgi:hypothetical protein